MVIHVQCAGCGGKFQAPEKLAGKRVKCPKCGQPLAVPAPQPAAARPAGDLDLEQLLGAEAGAPGMPSAPLPRLAKKKRRSKTGLIVGLSVGAGGAVLMLLLILLLWPSGEDKELAKNEAEPNEQSQVAVAMPVDLEKEYPWLGESAPFDVADFLASSSTPRNPNLPL